LYQPIKHSFFRFFLMDFEISNEELEAELSKINSMSDPSTLERNMLIGIKEGESSFEVESLAGKTQLRQDGIYNNSKRFDESYVTEYNRRVDALQNDPNYKFMVLLAGLCGTEVEQLYDLPEPNFENQLQQYVSFSQKAQIETNNLKLEDLEKILKKYKDELQEVTENIQNLQSIFENERLILEEDARFVDPTNPKNTHKLDDPNIFDMLWTFRFVSQNLKSSPQSVKSIIEKSCDNAEFKTKLWTQFRRRYVDSYTTVRDDDIKLDLISQQALNNAPVNKNHDISKVSSVLELNSFYKSVRDYLKNLIPHFIIVNNAIHVQTLLSEQNLDPTSLLSTEKEYSLGLEPSTASVSDLSAIYILKTTPKLVKQAFLRSQLLNSANMIQILRSSFELLFMPQSYNVVLELINPAVQGDTIFSDDLMWADFFVFIIHLYLYNHGGSNHIVQKRNPNFEYDSKTADQSGSMTYDFLKSHLDYIEKELTKERTVRTDLSQKVDKIKKLIDSRINSEVTIKRPSYPYTASPQWSVNPINTGIVRIKPVFVSGIAEAYSFVKQFSKVGKSPLLDIELLQKDPEVNIIFAKLVSVLIATTKVIFPKEYRLERTMSQLNIVKRNSIQKLDMYKIVKDRVTGEKKFSMKTDNGYNNIFRSK
jgi:hypothetical protein